MRLSIVIVNYRTAALTVDCLCSLAADPSRSSQWQVTLVDNASPDNSADALRSAIVDNGWQDWVTLVVATENSGFAGGNNVAIHQVLQRSPADRPNSVLLLNPDTIVRPHAIRRLEQFLEQHPKAGIAGSRLEDLDGTPQRSAFRFPTLCGELDGALRLGVVSQMLKNHVIAPPIESQPHQAEWVAGASMLIRTEVLEQIGALDIRYFMYYEETDFCLQARRAGWETWYVPDSRVVHLVGQSSGVTDNKKPRRRLPRYWYDSRRRYFQKNHGRFYALCAEMIWQISHAMWRTRMFIQGRANNEPVGRLSDGFRWIIWPLATFK